MDTSRPSGPPLTIGTALMLAVVIGVPLFLRLDTLPICLWDESRLAANAYEMHKGGSWLVTHFDGAPHLWNTKPPLMIWLQVLCIRLIGVSELAIRLPAAVAALFTPILLWLDGLGCS